MATNGIWKISKRLDHVIDYTTNIEKTINNSYDNENYQDLHNTIDYTTASYKTEKQCYVSGINCSPEMAFDEMMITKKAFEKTDGILGFHAFQSFAEGEVTPELAHSLGIKLAEEMWGDRFEVVVSTHLNTNHIHNHFVINSVSFKDGKRYYDKRETYARFRHLSNEICEEAGLKVLKEKACRNSGINYANYYKNDIQKSNYYTITKQDIDKAIAMAYSLKDFENILTAMDYKFYYRYGKLSVRRYPYKKNIRIERSFGEEYSVENIKERILTTQAPREPFPEAYSSLKKYLEPKKYDKKKHKGIYGLFLHYCYLLKVFPEQYPHKKLSPQIRADVEKMDKIFEETKLLVGENIETYEQFLLYKLSKTKELDLLLDERSKLWYQHKKVITNQDKEEIRQKIDILSEKIKPLKEVMLLCESIDDRIPDIQKKVEDISDNDTNKRKEK